MSRPKKWFHCLLSKIYPVPYDLIKKKFSSKIAKINLHVNLGVNDDKYFSVFSSLLTLSSCGTSHHANITEKVPPPTSASELLPVAAPKTNGLVIKVLRQGKGDGIKNFEKAKVHYTGKLTNGKVFDSSRKHNQAFDFVVGAGQVIKGWDLGVEGMKVGEIRKLTIAPHLGYGDQGAAGVIPPKATLIFDVELLAIEK